MHNVDTPELEPLAVALPLTDVSDKLILREHFGAMGIDGRQVSITRSLGGLYFYLELFGHTEQVNLNQVFQAWGAGFVARAEAAK